MTIVAHLGTTKKRKIVNLCGQLHFVGKHLANV